MGDIDGETLDWLNSLKLGEKLQYISDFENGYYMGVIFDRHNLAKGRKFKNTKDTACKFQNYKNVRDLLLENFNVQFPIQNILFSTEQLLQTIKECILKYNRDKKQAAMKKIQSFSMSKIQPHEQKLFANRHKEILSTSKMNQSKFPKKIQQIQQKLEKYKYIKTQHELMALEDRKKQLEDNRRLIDEHRVYEINKVKTNHQFIKEHQRKVYDVWMKTQQIKQARIEKDSNLKSFLQEKKNKFYQSLRDQEVKSLKDGLQAFNLNCIRQGIELQHDPDKPLRKTQQNFNKQVVMQRIKDNIKIHQKQRKQRVKRQNKKTVDAKEANIKSQMIWSENNLVQKYAKRIKTQIYTCEKIKKTLNRQEAERIGAAQKNSIRTFSELPQSKIDVTQRNEEYRKRKIQYLDEKVERLERRQRKHKAIAENVLQALIHIVIQSEQQYKSNNGFNFQEWKGLQKEFLTYERRDKRSKDQSKFIDSSYENKAKEYINGKENWEISGEKQVKLQLSEAISSVISIGFPERAAPEKNNIPLYMPLKISLVGDSLVGKTTLSQKIAQKYGIVFINPVSIISQAFELNKQPIVQDPKKKKDSKKPQQQNPEKLALKEWGQKLMKRLANPSNATVQHYIQAIQFKINYNFTNKQGQQILKEFQQSKVQETQRYNKALKQFEEIQKKGKKDSKKGAQQSEEPPTQRKYFYSKGFVIDGIDLSPENMKEIERKLNGYMSFEEKINQKGEQIKETISNIIKVRRAEKDTRLVPGTFDLVIELSASQQTLETRQTAQKTKNAHKDLASLESFYSDFGNQLTKAKAYKKIRNDATVDECFTEISRIIQEHLDSKYNQISSLKTVSKQEDKAVNQQAQSKISSFSIISKSNSQNLLNKLMQIYTKYSNKISQSFSDFDNLRDNFSKNFLSTQQTFINIINRPDDKAGKILNFQQNYNKLQSQKVNIVKDAEASKHLISKLDQLYDGLWVSLSSKKNEAVQQRQKLLSSNMLNNQIEKVVQVSRNLLQNELTLLVEIIFFIYNLNNILQGSQEELSPQYLVLGIPPNLQPIYSFEKQEFMSDRLDYYTGQVKQCLKDLPNWLLKREKKFKIKKTEQIELILNEFIQDRRAKIQQKIEKIRERVKEYYLEYYCYFNVLVNKMDDWIIQGIKYQNQFVYDIYKSIKKNIQQAKRSGIKDLFVKDITDILHPLTSLPANRLPITTSTAVNHFKVLSYATFMQQLKCLSTNGRIHFKVFQSYIEKRRKSQLLEKEFLSIELDIMQQYLVTDDYCNYKEVALAMLLWKIKILQEDQINQYENKLTRRKPTHQENYSTVKEELNLDEFAVIPEISQDKNQRRILKVFIFEIFRQDFRDTISVKQLIDTLRLFSQLQVYKYGDTLMMLRETSHKQVEVAQ